MKLELDGDVALVVGAARGIGRAISDAYAEHGARVAMVDVQESVESAAGEVAAESGAETMARVADATDLPAVEQIVASIRNKWDRCDHVVYAAGTGSGKYGFPFWNLEPADWERVWRVNVMGAVNVAHAMVDEWTSSQRGTFLLISSVAGQIGSPTDPPYSAAKAAIINFGQCAARDLAAYNVRVNTICPGMIQTTLNRSVWQAWNEQQAPESRQSYDEWASDKIAKVTPLGRWQQPDDIAAMAVFLSSRRAHNITGQTINVDGGQVMHW